MALNYNKILEAEKLFQELVGSELSQIIDGIAADPGSAKSFFIEIPEADSVDFTVEELASKVARTSNVYNRVARLAGMARAQLSYAEEEYKRQYKAHKVGKNEAEREANAIENTKHEAAVVNLLRSVVSMAETGEAGARIASETARKLLDKVSTMDIAQRRESRGQYLPKDFN